MNKLYYHRDLNPEPQGVGQLLNLDAWQWIWRTADYTIRSRNLLMDAVFEWEGWDD